MYVEAMEEEAKRIHGLSVKVEERVEEAIVTGAGDSFAACLTVEGKTRGRLRCVDPYDLLEWDPPRSIVIVSLSGRPKVYSWLAERFGGKSKIIAVTANPNSRVARSANIVVEIPYRSKVQLPGTLSFIATLKTLYALANVEEQPERGKIVPLGENPFFIGRLENFGIAYFASLKISEIFGERSNSERLEQFLHSPIFSTQGRNVILFSSGDKREIELREAGMANFYSTECATSLCNAESVILSVVSEMKRRNWDRIFYLENKNILKLSSDMIY
ncbi:hypothetical protein DFR87_02735 [Metallosphaera hakonensis JCM 8857 = DSM 7519]|uniref:SIS domain-containing protein n=2 Tax=Metallosphaera hakonensis TaxID=79601 RepID=A0A2U9IS07_9CREN|nr:hypothetical protein DFR87_02735 [Metallosphaera hakonensis JCM 8857 = DSM 7519]